MNRLKSFIEALGGKLNMTATFPDTAVNLRKIADTPVFAELQALVLKNTTVQISRERDRGLLKTRIVSRLDGHLARAGYRVAEPTVLSKLDGRA